MRNIIAVLLLSAIFSNAQSITVVKKDITDQQLSGIIEGVKQMGIRTPTPITITNLNQVVVYPSAEGYTVNIGLNPIIRTSTTDTGLDIERVSYPKVRPLTIPPAAMQGIFDLAIGSVGNMNPPLTISNFSVMTLTHPTNHVGWEVQARMKYP